MKFDKFRPSVGSACPVTLEGENIGILSQAWSIILFMNYDKKNIKKLHIFTIHCEKISEAESFKF